MRKVVTDYGKLINAYPKIIYRVVSNNRELPFVDYEKTNINYDDIANRINIEEQPNKTSIGMPKSHLGFVNAFEKAYITSSPLELRPDIFYLVILQSLSKHIENNAQKYKHIDKKFIIPDDNDVINVIGNQIREKINFDSTLKFSTSTEVSSNVNDITLLGTCKPYRTSIPISQSGKERKCGLLEGITEFHIQGTVDDWNNLINKVNFIGKTFDLKFWTDIVAKVLSFIRNANPKDTSFWNGAYKHRRLINLFKNNVDANGWFLAFFLYTDENKLTSWKKIGDKFGGEYPSQITSTPFVYIRYSKKMNMELQAGICGVFKDKTTKAYSPCIGWAVNKLDSKVMSVIEENDVINHWNDSEYLHKNHFKF